MNEFLRFMFGFCSIAMLVGHIIISSAVLTAEVAGSMTCRRAGSVHGQRPRAILERRKRHRFIRRRWTRASVISV